MRVAHVISTRRGAGGAERIVAALLRRGLDEGWDQVVVNPFADRDEDTALARMVPEVRNHIRAGSSAIEIPAIRRWTARVLDEVNADIVHVHLFHAVAIVGSLRRRPENLLLTHHHGDFLRMHGRRIEAAIDRRMGRRFDRIVAVSDAVREFLVSDYGYDADRVTTIRNGWEGAPLPRTQSAVPTIVAVGNLRVEKGHAVLLRALVSVKREVPDVRVVLVGDGPLRGDLERLTQVLELEDSVEFTGAVDDVWPELAAADVFAMPSLSEPLGIAAMEAMAAGVPVVGSDVGGIPEVVRPDTGYLVPPDDPDALATRLIELLRDKEKRTEMGAVARTTAEGYTMTRMLDAYVRLYEQQTAGR